MNVLSLPDEMIAYFTKYMNYEECKRMRKINKRLDSVAKNYKLNGMNLKRVIVDKNGAVYDVDGKEFDNVWRREEDQVKMEQLLTSTRKVEHLILYKYCNEEALSILLNFPKVLKNSKLESWGHIDVSAEDLKNFANKMKISRLTLLECRFSDKLLDTFTDKVLAEFDPSVYVELVGPSFPKITLLGLQSRVFSNKLMLSLSETQITSEDMVKFLKNNKAIENNLHLGTLKEQNMEVHMLLEELENCGFKFTENPDDYGCKLIKESNGVVLTFACAR